jgi:hypothetical protein
VEKKSEAKVLKDLGKREREREGGREGGRERERDEERERGREREGARWTDAVTSC